MKEEGIDRNLAIETLRPTVDSFLSQLEPQEVHAQPGFLGGIGYIQYDLDELWKLHEISAVFGLPNETWFQEIEKRQKENVEYALEVDDPVTAVEVREKYIQTLLKQNRVQEAIQHALSITDGIDTSEPEKPDPSDFESTSKEAFSALIEWSGKSMGAWQLNQKRGRVIRNIAIHLIEQGKITEAEDLVRRTDEEIQSFSLFDALLGHYQKVDDFQAIHELMGKIDIRLGELEPESIDYRFIRATRNKCLQSLANKAIETSDRRIAIEYAEKISVPAAKIAWYEEYVDHLVNQGETTEAKRVVNRIMEMLDQETEWEEENIEFDESVGRLDWTSERRGRKQFSLHNRATKLIDFAEQFTDCTDFDDVVDRLIDGSKEDGNDGIIFAIEHSALKGQVYLRGKLMELFSRRGDWKRMDEEYHETLRRHTDSQDSINAKLAEILINEDPEQAKNIIVSLTDPKIKCNKLSEFYLTCFQRGTLDVSQWRTYAREIEMIENTLLNKGEWNADITELLDEGAKEEDIPEDNDPSLATVAHFGSWAVGDMPSGEESFWRISPHFISSAALIAYKRGRYDVMTEVINDARVDINSKIRILHEVSLKLRDGNTIARGAN